MLGLSSRLVSSRRTIVLLSSVSSATGRQENLAPVDRPLGWPRGHRVSRTEGLHSCAHLLAGHNKWSKVKNIKIPKDIARSHLIAKTLNLMRACINKKGTSDPANNIELSHLVEFCKKNDIPKATYQRALKSDGSKNQEILIEARGPQGLLFLIRAFTDKAPRVRQDVKNIIKKRGGDVVSDGVVRRMFEQKSVVSCLHQLEDGSVLDADRAMDVAILSGAEEVLRDTSDDGTDIFMFIADKFQLNNVVSALTEHNLHILSAETPFLPTMPVPCSDDMLQFAANLIESIKGHADVLDVFDNIESQSSS